MNKNADLVGTVPRERRAHHAPEDDAGAAVEHGQGPGLAAAAGAEDLHHQRADEEGDGEGGRHHPPRDHEGADAEVEQ